MSVQRPILSLFEQLHQLLETMADLQYCQGLQALSQSSIGQHLRHIIEFFNELDRGYETGSVNYDQRARDHQIETDRSVAMRKLREIANGLSKHDKTMILTASFPLVQSKGMEFQTNYHRELLYNLEHTVHHMALIRIGIESISSIQLPIQFGVAESTLQSKKICVQ